ncbi:hypothetical protein DEJ21_15795 [Curtobacterium sp. MCSS17_006]|nr:hypothetical protein DEJ21_15795 [Curtobacterium sp. MCSS17_006]
MMTVRDVRTRASIRDTEWRPQPSATRREVRTVPCVEDVRLELVGDDQWRVMNAALEPTDVTALLGFVERIAGFFEATFFTDPTTIHRFLTGEDARRAFAPSDPTTDAPVVVEAGTSGPGAIPMWLQRSGPERHPVAASDF